MVEAVTQRQDARVIARVVGNRRQADIVPDMPSLNTKPNFNSMPNLNTPSDHVMTG